MLKSYRSVLVGTTSVMALAMASAAPTAAQEQQQAQAIVGLESITVTARRVEENIQRVPIAIQAFTPEALAEQDIKDIWSLTRNIAGLNICCSQGNTSFIFLRGIGNGAPTYFADVPSSSNGFSNMFDISNVQVLKGPQGTLFGQASNAGAIVYTPRKPGDVLGGYAEVSVGQYGRKSIEAAVDIPIIEDKLLFRMAGTSYGREGYVTDVTTNKDHGDQNYFIIRPSITFRPTDNLEIYTMYQYDKLWSNTLPFLLEDFNFSPPGQFSLLGVQALLNYGAGEFTAAEIAAGRAWYDQTYAGVANANSASYDQLGAYGALLGVPGGQSFDFRGVYGAWSLRRAEVLAQQLALGDYAYNGFSTGCAASNTNDGSCLYSTGRHQFLTNTITYDLTDNITIKNIFGYAFGGKDTTEMGDTDGSPLAVFDGGHINNDDPTKPASQWSNEVQIIWSDMFNGLLDMQFGTFHRHQKNNPSFSYGRFLGWANSDFTDAIANGGNPVVYGAVVRGNAETLSISKNSNRSRAIYGQGNLDLGQLVEGLTFTGGLRYTWDTTIQTVWNVNTRTGAVSQSGGAGTPTGQGKWKNLSYTAQLQYQYNPDIMFFINNSRGFGSGGLQNVYTKEAFQPDVLNNIEVGTKATFNVGDVGMRFNASYFHGWFDDVKVSVTQLARREATGPENLIVVTENAAKGIIKGFEADLTVVPTDWLEIGGFYAYTDTSYKEWPSNQINPTTGLIEPISLANTPFSFVPKHKWTLRATYTLPVDASWGDMSLSANLTRTGNMYNGAKRFEPLDPANPNTGIICFKDRTAANFYPAAVRDGKRVYINCVPPHYNLDMNFNWSSVAGYDGLDAILSVTNITKNEVNEGGCYCDAALGVNSPTPYPPRMWALRLKYSF